MIKDNNDRGELKWAIRFINLAEHIAEWSKDPSTKVGAVVVDDLNRVISLGFNGFPRGVRDTEPRYADRKIKYRMIVHSEENAIYGADRPVRGMTLYTTLFPCSSCAKTIIQSGIALVVFSRWPTLNWLDDAKISATMMEEAGLRLQLLDKSDTVIRLIDYSNLDTATQRNLGH